MNFIKVYQNIVLLLASTLCILQSGCGKSFTQYSPNKSLKLIAHSQKGIIFLEIINSKGKLLYNARTGASSYQRWSVEWVTNNKILFKSSDIGDFFWVKVSEEVWQRQPANIAFSPGKKRLVIVTWSSYRDKTVKMQIAKPFQDYLVSNTATILSTIITDKKVSDLAGCVSWPEPNLIVLKGDYGVYEWQKAETGTWCRCPASSMRQK